MSRRATFPKPDAEPLQRLRIDMIAAVLRVLRQLPPAERTQLRAHQPMWTANRSWRDNREWIHIDRYALSRERVFVRKASRTADLRRAAEAVVERARQRLAEDQRAKEAKANEATVQRQLARMLRETGLGRAHPKIAGWFDVPLNDVRVEATPDGVRVKINTLLTVEQTKRWLTVVKALQKTRATAQPDVDGHCHNGLQCLAPVSCICLCCRRSRARG